MWLNSYGMTHICLSVCGTLVQVSQEKQQWKKRERFYFDEKKGRSDSCQSPSDSHHHHLSSPPLHPTPNLSTPLFSLPTPPITMSPSTKSLYCYTQPENIGPKYEHFQVRICTVMKYCMSHCCNLKYGLILVCVVGVKLVTAFIFWGNLFLRTKKTCISNFGWTNRLLFVLLEDSECSCNCMHSHA